MSNIQTSALKIYGNGGGMLPNLNSEFRYLELAENAIQIYDYNNNGVFEYGDYILFYGMSADIWDFNYNSSLLI